MNGTHTKRPLFRQWAGGVRKAMTSEPLFRTGTHIRIVFFWAEGSKIISRSSAGWTGGRRLTEVEGYEEWRFA